jgi:regulator of RNase E activity RraA
MVCQDMDTPPRGCAWGDVSASIFLRLGCSAVITNGAVRDIREAGALGFGMFAATAIVGHANVRFVDVGSPVTVGGLAVAPGDLLHADEHGVVLVPREINLGALIDMIERLLRSEAAVIDYARNDTGFSLEDLGKRMDRLNAAGGHHLR